MSTKCRIKNRGASHISYRIPEDNIRRSFAPGEVKEVTYEELEKLTFQPGGIELLAGFLQILDEEAIQQVGIRVEPEYYMSEQDVVALMKTGSLDAFLDALDFAPQSIIDMIKVLSTKLPLTDYDKRKALKAKTGFDVDAALKHIEEEKAEEPAAATTTERRVKTEETATTPARRTTPTYNVLNKTE